MLKNNMLIPENLTFFNNSSMFLSACFMRTPLDVVVYSGVNIYIQICNQNQGVISKIKYNLGKCCYRIHIWCNFVAYNKNTINVLKIQAKPIDVFFIFKKSAS